MPWSIEVLDSMALRGDRACHADYNLLSQDGLRDNDQLAIESYAAYSKMHDTLDLGQKDEEHLAVYMCSPLKAHADRLCTITHSERLEELRHPQSLTRWSYVSILPLMLGCTDKVDNHHFCDVFDAAQSGLQNYHSINPGCGLNRAHEPDSEIQFITYHAMSLLGKMMRSASILRIEKAIFTSIPEADIPSEDMCSICFVSLKEENEATSFMDMRSNQLYFDIWICHPEFFDCAFRPVDCIHDADIENWRKDTRSALKKLYRKSKEYTLDSKWFYYADTEQKFQRQWLEGLELVYKVYHTRLVFRVWTYSRMGNYKSSYYHELKLGHSVKLPCNHIFHRECIRKWLCEGSGTCPFCRKDIAEYSNLEGGRAMSDWHLEEMVYQVGGEESASQEDEDDDEESGSQEYDGESRR